MISDLQIRQRQASAELREPYRAPKAHTRRLPQISEEVYRYFAISGGDERDRMPERIERQFREDMRRIYAALAERRAAEAQADLRREPGILD